MHIETVKFVDCCVPLATKADVRGSPHLPAQVTTAWSCRDLILFLFLVRIIIPSLGGVARSGACSDLALECIIMGISKWTYIEL